MAASKSPSGISAAAPLPMDLHFQKPQLQPVPELSRNREADDSDSFRVPAGEAPNGRLVRADKAKADVSYRCPGCHTPLILRTGAVRARHFAHKSHGFCSPETALHQGVKNRLAQILAKSRTGTRRGAPRILVRCSGNPLDHGPGSEWKCPGAAWFSLADLAYDEVAVERTTTDGLRPDILLLLQGKPVLAIEVRVSHAVDAGKAEKLSCPWVELDAARILVSPRKWIPVQGCHPWSGQCRICATLGAVDPNPFSEVTDLGDFLAQMAARVFLTRITEWLAARNRLRPGVTWRCPTCSKSNCRPFLPGRIRGIGAASFLGPPIRPGVIVEVEDGSSVLITFAFPVNPHRPKAVTPLTQAKGPLLAVTPSLEKTHRLGLNGTNRPLAFVCTRCGGDALGAFPNPSVPWRAPPA